MSRSRTRRTVSSTTQRAVIQRELRRSRLEELQTLLAGPDHNAESPATGVLDRASTIGDLRVSLEAEADPLVALELVKAECRALTRQAATAGINRSEIDALMHRIEELLVLADIAPLDQELAAIDDAYSDAAAFEARVVDAMNRVQTLRLAGIAATLVLGRMGFDITDEVLLGDEVRVLSTSQAGQRVEVSIDGHPPCIEVVTGDHTSVAHAILYEDQPPGHGAIDLAAEFHALIEQDLREAGLAVGPVERVTRRRSATKFWQLPRPAGHAGRTSPGERSHH